MADYWKRAAACWRSLGPPLCPDEEVVAAYARLLRERDGKALLFGVTPQLSGLCQPLLAIDCSPAMIDLVWPGDGEGRQAILGDWFDIPVGAESFDICLGDGCPSAVSFPDQTQLLFREVDRVLRPGGTAVFRLFCSPDEPTSTADVFSRAEEGRIPSFHSFKFQVAGAIAHETGCVNVAVAGVRQAILARYGSLAATAAAGGWPDAPVATLDYYKGSKGVIAYPRRAEFRDLAKRYFASVDMAESGTYEAASLYPMLVLKKA